MIQNFHILVINKLYTIKQKIVSYLRRLILEIYQFQFDIDLWRIKKKRDIKIDCIISRREQISNLYFELVIQRVQTSAAALTFVCSHKNFQELDMDNRLRILRNKLLFNQSTVLTWLKPIKKKQRKVNGDISKVWWNTFTFCRDWLNKDLPTTALGNDAELVPSTYFECNEKHKYDLLNLTY